MGLDSFLSASWWLQRKHAIKLLRTQGLRRKLKSISLEHSRQQKLDLRHKKKTEVNRQKKCQKLIYKRKTNAQVLRKSQKLRKEKGQV